MPLESLWPWLRWIQWLNLLTYSFHLIMQVVFRGNETFTCDPDASAFVVCKNASRAVNSTSPSPLAPVGTITSADILAHYDVNRSVALCVGVAIGASFFLRFLAYQCLRRDMLTKHKCSVRGLLRRAKQQTHRSK